MIYIKQAVINDSVILNIFRENNSRVEGGVTAVQNYKLDPFANDRSEQLKQHTVIFFFFLSDTGPGTVWIKIRR